MSDNLWRWLSTSPVYSENACECLGRLTLVLNPAERTTVIQQLYHQLTADMDHQMMICVARLKGFATGLKDDASSLGVLGALAAPALCSILTHGTQDIVAESVDIFGTATAALLVLLQNTSWEQDLETAVSILESAATSSEQCLAGLQHANLHAFELAAPMMKVSCFASTICHYIGSDRISFCCFDV